MSLNIYGARSLLNENTASFTVSGGTFTANIAARDAVAIHTGAIGIGSSSGSTSGGGSSTSNTVSVNFAETATTTFGEVRSISIKGVFSHWLTLTF